MEEEYGYGLRGRRRRRRRRGGRGVRWVFIRSPAAQKHPYATRIAELLAVPHISMGTLVLQELDPSSSLYKKEILDQITDIDVVVNFKCVKECLVKKHFGSDICWNCGQSFDAGNSKSASLKSMLGNS